MMKTIYPNCYPAISDEFSRFQVDKGDILPTWIFIGSKPTLNLFKNTDLLMGIRTVGDQANIYTYTGIRLTKQVGHQPLFNIDTWFYPQGTANIISLAIVNKNYPVAFDTTGNLFTFHLQERDIVFRQSTGGLYYFDTTAEEDFVGAIRTSVIDNTPNETCFMSKVTENLSWFTPRQFIRAKLAWHIYATSGRPSGREF